jgi:hypothetical protein
MIWPFSVVNLAVCRTNLVYQPAPADISVALSEGEEVERWEV